METPPANTPSNVQPPKPAGFRWSALAIWIPAAMVDGILVGIAANEVERYRSPLVLFSIIVGLVLGATLVGLSRLTQTGHRRTLLVGTLLATLTAVGIQHYLGYRSTLNKAQEDLATYQLVKSVFGSDVKGEQPVPPNDFWAYMRWRAARGLDLVGRRIQGAAVWGVWTLDLLLKLAAAVGVVLPAMKKPYCMQCGTWFRTTRRGRLEGETALATCHAAGMKAPDALDSARYWMVRCRSGCGPTGFELSWKASDGSSASEHVWLDTTGRNQIATLLDASIERT